jgi:hypothetical protein
VTYQPDRPVIYEGVPGTLFGSICSHIDAVLFSGERAMVHPEDIGMADIATPLAQKYLALPSQWRGSWRKNLRWRGLSGSRPFRTHRSLDKAKPLVCFTGTLPVPRTAAADAAKAAGWEVMGSASKVTTVLVTENPMGTSRKLVAARAAGTPIVSYEEWQELMLDGELPS